MMILNPHRLFEPTKPSTPANEMLKIRTARKSKPEAGVAK